MSFKDAIVESIEQCVAKFIKEVANKKNINEAELTAIWLGNSGSMTTSMTTTSSTTEYSKMKVAELKAICKKHGLKMTGTKDVLVKAIEEFEAKKSNPVEKSSQIDKNKVIEKLNQMAPTIVCRRNQFGNYEHPPSKLVLDRNTKKVIGKQCEDGSLEDLDLDDIEKCKLYKFEYDLPENLDKTTSINDIKIDELEDDEIIEEESDEELNEEELMEEYDEEYDEVDEDEYDD